MRTVLRLLLLLFTGLLPASTPQLLPCVRELPAPTVERDERGLSIRGYLTRDAAHLLEQGDRLILETPGGSLSGARHIMEVASAVTVRGICKSACAVMLVEYDHICIDPSVEVIAFHSVVVGMCTTTFDRYEHRPDITRSILAKVREPLKTRLMHLTTGNRWEHIPRSDFLAVYPERECPHTPLTRAYEHGSL